MNNFTSLLSFKSRSQEAPPVDEFMPTREEAVYLPGLIVETDIFESQLAAIIAHSAMQYVPKHRGEAPKHRGEAPRHRGEPETEDAAQQYVPKHNTDIVGVDQLSGARNSVAEAYEQRLRSDNEFASQN